MLHLSEHHGDGTPGSGVFVRTTELDAFHAEITSKGYPFMRPGIEEAPWGGRIMTVIDSFQGTSKNAIFAHRRFRIGLTIC